MTYLGKAAKRQAQGRIFRFDVVDLTSPFGPDVRRDGHKSIVYAAINRASMFRGICGTRPGTIILLNDMAPKTARKAAEAVITKLSDAGFEALLAGGCVRDLLLGQEPKDYDVATTAKPEEVCRFYPKAQKVGAHFGVVIVRQFGHLVEVATFRTEGEYKDGRHPERVTFTTAEEDARRRDFTINGMFYDLLNHRVIDYVHGQEDLQNKLIQAIGNPERRFEEDHLRMLRAVRFAARLGFHIEQETFEAIYNRADKIRLISAERIREELEEILTHRNRADGFDMLCATGLLPHLWRNSQWSTELVKKSKRALSALPEQVGFPPAFATMLYHQDHKTVNRLCRELTCSNRVRTETVWLSSNLHQLAAASPKTLADLKLLMAGPCFDDLCELFRAYLSAESLPLQAVEQLRTSSQAIAPEEIAPHPLLSGDDLLEMGVTQGPIFKKVLDEIYYRQLNLELTSREQALALARQLSEHNSS